MRCVPILCLKPKNMNPYKKDTLKDELRSKVKKEKKLKNNNICNNGYSYNYKKLTWTPCSKSFESYILDKNLCTEVKCKAIKSDDYEQKNKRKRKNK